MPATGPRARGEGARIYPVEAMAGGRRDHRADVSGLPGWTARVVFGGEQTAGRFAIIEGRGVRGASMPLHVHHNEDEYVYVLDGEISVCTDGERRLATADETVLLPRSGEHSFVVESESARVLVLLSPAGMEGLITEMVQLVTGPPAQAASRRSHIERLVGMAARYDCDITGPPPARRQDGACPYCAPEPEKR